MKSRLNLILFLLFSIQLHGMSLADMFANSNQIVAEQKTEESADAALVSQQQKFVSSTAYENVISIMQSSGVMDNFEGLITTLKSGSDVDEAKMADVVADLTDLFTNMITAYNDSGMPIMATAGNGAYNYFATIALLYTARLRYLAANFYSVAKSGKDYSVEFSDLLTAFSTYQSSLKDLTKHFPTTSSNSQMTTYYSTLPSLAMNDYYLQAGEIILTKVSSVVDLASIASTEKYDQAVWAIGMYNDLIKITELQIPSSMYDSFTSYQSALLTNLYLVCQNALNELSSCIDFVADPIFPTVDANSNKLFFEELQKIYSDAAAIYKNILGFSSQYSQLSSGLVDATKKYNAFEEVAKIMTSIQSTFEQIGSGIKTKNQSSTLNELLGTIQLALQDCVNAQADLTLIGDAVTLQVVQTLQNYLNVMNLLVYMKYYWSFYLEDSQSGAVALADCTSSFDVMTDANFMTHFTTLINSMKSLACIQSLQSVVDSGEVCSSPSANLTAIFNTGYDLSKLISGAVALINSSSSLASVTLPDCCNYSLLKDIKIAISQLTELGLKFCKVNATLQNIAPDQLSSLKLLIAEILISSKKLDELYAENSLIADYLPNLAVAVMPTEVETFFDMSMEIMVYVLGNLAQALITKEKYVEAATCYALLQGYKEHVSVEDEAFIINQLNILTTHVDLSAEAAKIVASAQSGNWTVDNDWMQNAAWLSGIQLYQLAYEVTQSSSTLSDYDQAIQNYISAYKSQVAVSDQEPLDLLYLYYLLIMNYNGTNNSGVADVAADLAALFKNDAKTGFFDLLDADLLDFMNEKDTSVLSEKKEAISDLMIEFQNALYAELSWIDAYELSFNKTMAPMLSIKDKNNGSKKYGFTFGNTVVSTTVPDLDITFASVVKGIADSNFALGKAASDGGDFVKAYENYSSALAQYKMIIDQTVSGDTVNAQYLLTKTLSEASLMASLVLRGDIQTLGNISDIAVTNLLSVYSFTLPTVISATLAASKLVPGTDGKTLSWNNDFMKKILKLVALNSELTHSGYSYAQLFSPGTTNIVSGLNSSDSAIAQNFVTTAEQFASIVSNAMSSGTVINGQTQIMTAVATIDTASNITITCLNMPIASLVSYYADHPNAAQYYGAALMLYTSGNDNVQVGNVVYVPGNDDVAAQKMRLYTAATAMATTKLYVDEIAASMIIITNEIAQAKTMLEQYPIVTEFNSKVKDKYNKIISILLDPTTGAISYYRDNNAVDFANNAQMYAMSLYEEYQKNIETLLVGDPTSALYTSILYNLNMAYQTQAIYTTDANLLLNLKTKVAELFKTAGDACMNYVAVDDAGITKHYYENAATYYNAAVAKYTANGDSANTKATEILEYAAHAKHGLQNMAVYFYSKINGVSYSDANGILHNVKLDTLIADYKAFSNQFSSLTNDQSISPSEMTLYNNIETLFLNGAMVLSAAASGPPSSASDTDATSTASSTTDGSYLDPAVVTFLTNNEVTLTESTQTIDNPNYIAPAETDPDVVGDGIASALNSIKTLNSTTTEGAPAVDDNPETIEIPVYTLPQIYDTYQTIFGFDAAKTTSLAIQGIDQYLNDKNKAAMLSWLSTLFNAAAYVYIHDYLGVATSSGSTTDDVSSSTNAQEEFYERLQAQGVANQNPASIYMG